MAEIGLVASIFGIAAFGTKVATSLYETADVMIHARQQIAAMAKHVSQFTTVLRQLGRVLEAEKGNCSKDLLREIRKIKVSCDATFKEINATIKSKRSRSFASVRWLFKKPAAKELEARLDSEQSMLQVVIHTLTVSKLGDIQSKSKDDAKQLSALREEIGVLKTMIIESYNGVAKLRHAEERTEAEARRGPFPPPFLRPGSDIQGQPSSSRGFVISRTDGIPSRRLLSPESSLSGSDHIDVRLNKATYSARQMPLRGNGDREVVESSDDDPLKANTRQQSAVQPHSIHNRPEGLSKYRASTLLLQMVPYRPKIFNTPHYYHLDRLISDGQDGPAWAGADQKPALEEATESIRLLLDKWTSSGSAPISDILIEETAKDHREAEERSRHRRSVPSPSSRPPPPPRSQWSMSDLSSDEYDDTYDPPHRVQPHHMQSGYVRPRAALRIKDVWKSPYDPGQGPPIIAGDEFLVQLRRVRGGILYSKKNDFLQSYYVDRDEFYRFYLVPLSIIPPDHLNSSFTEIGKGWVRKEALELLSYTYSETPFGDFSISGNLGFAEIEELVRLSFQANDRVLEERSKQLIEQRGLGKIVVALKQQMPSSYPTRHPAYSPESRGRRGRTYTRYPWSDAEDGHGARGIRHGPFPQRPEVYPSSGDGPTTLQRTREGKPVPSTVQFTIPRLENSAGRAERSLPSLGPDARTEGKELKEAIEKLELLKNKRDKTQDGSVKQDLTYYAIPDMERRIKELKRAQEKYEKSAPAASQARAPHTVVETDSESSAGPDSERLGVHSSDNGPATHDLYD